MENEKGRNKSGKRRRPVEKTVNPIKFEFVWMLSGLPCLMLASSHFLKRAGLAFVPLEFKHNFRIWHIKANRALKQVLLQLLIKGHIPPT